MNIEKIKLFMTSKKFMVIVGFLGLYLVSTGISLAAFTFLTKSPTAPGDDGTKRARVDLSKPKTEVCPLNGAKFTVAEKNIWEERRPIAAMIENHLDSRPQSGLSKADVVYEAVAEGGITRFLAIFYCNVIAEETNIAPVRSARIYFINYAQEYVAPIFMHVGGANNFSGSGDTTKEVRALEYLETIGWRVPRGNDFDTIYDSGFPVFWRNYERLDREVATEHTMMASLDAAYGEAKKRGYTNEDEDGNKWRDDFVSWKFADDKPASEVTSLSFSFWEDKPDYNVTWNYDSTNNSYTRVNGGVANIDLNTGEQITAKNVVTLFAKEKGPVDRNMHMFYQTIGTGDAILFQNGKAIDVTWEKKTAAGRTMFFDEDGDEISFVRGPIWIEVVPLGNKVDY